MPWVYKIVDIKTEDVVFNEATYYKVHFWRTRGAEARGDPPQIINEFIANLKPVRQRAVTDDRGFLLRESGVYASIKARGNPDDATVMEDFNVDVVGEMEASIERFIKMAVGRDLPNVNLSDSRFVPTTADPRGILARADVQAAKDRKREFRP